MAIELLLNPSKTWARIKAGFAGNRMYKSVPPVQKRSYVDGVDSMVKEAQGLSAAPGSGAFSGKTFSQRKK